MTLNLKALGLALVAALALSAIVASAAHAVTNPKITAVDGSALTLDAETNESERFTAFGASVTCTNSKYTGKPINENKAVTIEPVYTGCHSQVLFLKFPATVTMNGCAFILYHLSTDGSTVEHTASDITHFYNSTTEIECPKEKVIEVHIYKNHTDHTANKYTCTLTVGPQTVENGPTIDVTTKKGTVRLTGNVKNLKAEAHNTSSSCPAGEGTPSTTTAEQDLATGGIEVTGTTAGGASNPFHIG